MTIFLPRNLFSQIHEDAAVNPASRRKVVLPRITRQLLELQGYRFGDKIRVPGGYAFEVTDPQGVQFRLGLKTAVNRWLNTASTLVSMVDKVIVATFEWDSDDEKPVAFELIEISSPALLKMIDKVQKEAIKLGGDPLGHHYMPLDQLAIESDHVGSVAGAVIPAGRIVYGPEKVIWVKDDWGRVEIAPDVHVDDEKVAGQLSNALDVGTLVAKTKADLAAQLGISTDNIDLSIRF